MRAKLMCKESVNIVVVVVVVVRGGGGVHERILMRQINYGEKCIRFTYKS
jgi:hypothetical protein